MQGGREGLMSAAGRERRVRGSEEEGRRKGSVKDVAVTDHVSSDIWVNRIPG
ncbi:hypothetical protein E2C01_042120 [Portunus trituberculatus]|uniref:Uncharacterized protein n=1 Tax=Portunus trituberculatus TaxID=210409 RepID=A0A5B7FKY0_PORTR|nr:hypothetical protein [Portunus trituberculatus]